MFDEGSQSTKFQNSNFFISLSVVYEKPGKQKQTIEKQKLKCDYVRASKFSYT